MRKYHLPYDKPCLICCVSNCADLLGALGTEFTLQFADFALHKFKFELLSNLFAVDMERAPVNLQMELIDLRCNDTLKAK